MRTERERPAFALSVFFVLMTLLCFMSLTSLPRKPEADGLATH